jgi:hypothetical protein
VFVFMTRLNERGDSSSVLIGQKVILKTSFVAFINISFIPNHTYLPINCNVVSKSGKVF